MSQFQPPFQQEPQPPRYQQPHTGYPQWQQPPQPYQPPPEPPRKRRARKEMIIAVSILLAILVILGGIGVFAYASANKGTPNTQAQATTIPTSLPTATPTELPTPTPAPTMKTTPTPTPNPHGDIGVSQQSDVWSVTVNSVKTSSGSQYITPKTGNVFVIINFTAKNTDSANHNMSGIFFTLIDSQGNHYSDTFLDSAQKDYGDVVSGQQLRGDAVFEIPKTIHQFILQFDPSFDPSLAVQWSLSE